MKLIKIKARLKAMAYLTRKYSTNQKYQEPHEKSIMQNKVMKLTCECECMHGIKWK